MKNQDYILYLDMDGVLVNYGKGVFDVSNDIRTRHGIDDPEEAAVIADQYILTPEFWANLGWILGGEELWYASNELFENVHILSSTASPGNVHKHTIIEKGKREWIRKNIHPNLSTSKIHIVSEGVEKANYAEELAILVDDRTTTIKAFRTAGGYGILHKASKYRDTISELTYIARPIDPGEIDGPVSLGEIARSILVRRRLWSGA